MIAGIVVCAWFIHRQGRLAHPLLDMRPLRNKTYALGETLIVLSYMSSIYLSLLIPLIWKGWRVSRRSSLVACWLRRRCAMRVCALSAGRMLGKAGVWPLVPVGFGRVPCRVRGACGVHAARSCAGHRGLHGACVRGNRHPSILRLRASIWKCSTRAVRERLVDPFHFGADRRIYFVGALRRSHVGAGSSFDGRWHGESAGLQRRFLDHRVPGGRLCSGSGHLIGGLRAPCGQADPWEVGHRRICRMGKGSPMPSVSERSNTSKP